LSTSPISSDRPSGPPQNEKSKKRENDYFVGRLVVKSTSNTVRTLRGEGDGQKRRHSRMVPFMTQSYPSRRGEHCLWKKSQKGSQEGGREVGVFAEATDRLDHMGGLEGKKKKSLRGTTPSLPQLENLLSGLFPRPPIKYLLEEHREGKEKTFEEDRSGELL